ncbi:MAG: 5-formyltetrahydrofolate cyclo-ligase [Deltaproteobacteria bacterium]|nr:5-formyltetrahydrofolate cyclo-ligase [Deltaproteobacteria bacterium]
MQRSQLKERLRAEILEMRRIMSFEDVMRLSALVQKRFILSGLFHPARRLALYSSFRNEPLTDTIFAEAVRLGKEVYFPRVVRGRRHLTFHRVLKLGDMAPGSYEISEPGAHEKSVEAAEFDLVVVPGAAFDKNGTRLGYGKGCYDRALKDARCPIAALAYEFQLVDGEIPAEPHDVPMAAIVTEARILYPA